MCQNLVEIEDHTEAYWSPSSADSNKRSTLSELHQFRKDHDTLEYGSKVDVYAMGILLYELLVHRQPWAGQTTGEVMRLVSEGSRPEVPAELEAHAPMWAKVMRACWAQQPLQRPTFTQIREELQGIPYAPEVQQRYSLRSSLSMESPAAPDVDAGGQYVLLTENSS